MPFQPESELELKLKDLENLSIYPTVISTPRYDKWFESYDFLKSARLLKFWTDQIFDLDWRWSHKTPLIEYGAESGEMSNVKVIYNFETFPESTNMPSYNQRFRSYGHWKLEEASVLDRSGRLDKLGLYAHFQKNSRRTPNTKILENFITFLTVGRT
jgi:hypothetical protein